MDHEPVLISTIAIGLTAAFIGGLIARHLRLPAIVGYIVAGVVIGPFTPGFIADTDIALELAELGVILLMFGVGIQFSIRELLAVRSIAVPGAILQTIVSGLFGIWLGSALGWSVGGGLVLGLAISIASTVVLLRALTDRHELETPQGRIAVGWLIVEDLLAVLVLVLLPTIAPILGTAASGEPVPVGPDTLAPVAIALAKAVAFALVMIVVGARLVPWLLLIVAREGSRELFTLAVLAIALGIAFVASSVFGVSLALGAFLAGLVVERVRHEPPGGRGRPAVARRLRGAVLRLGRHAARPGVPAREPAAGAGGRPADRRREGRHEVRDRRRRRLPDPRRPDRGGRARPDRRVLVHRRDGRSRPGPAAGRGFQLIVAGALLSITVNPLVFRLIDPLEARLRATPA